MRDIKDDIIFLLHKKIELLDELISKPEIIGSIKSIYYINKLLEIDKKLVPLEVKYEQR